MDLMKTIGGKITNKMKSGEISEEEIVKEASELMSKMKGLGGKMGSPQLAELMKNFAKGMSGGAGGKGKAQFNTAAFSKMERQYQAKERMLQKLDQKKNGDGQVPKRVFTVAGESGQQSKSSLSEHQKHQQNSKADVSSTQSTDEELIAMFAPKATPKKAKKQKK